MLRWPCTCMMRLGTGSSRFFADRRHLFSRVYWGPTGSNKISSSPRRALVWRVTPPTERLNEVYLFIYFCWSLCTGEYRRAWSHIRWQRLAADLQPHCSRVQDGSVVVRGVDYHRSASVVNESFSSHHVPWNDFTQAMCVVTGICCSRRKSTHTTHCSTTHALLS